MMFSVFVPSFTKISQRVSKKKKNGADMIFKCQKFTEAHIIKFIKNLCLLSAKLLIIFFIFLPSFMKLPFTVLKFHSRTMVLTLTS